MTQPALDTDEQLSGRAADAVADLHSELSRRYSGLTAAEAELADALLTAHATSEAGRRRLQDIQRQVVEAIGNPVNALDTPAGERQFLMFLRTKIADIQSVVNDGTLTAGDQAELTRALANGYLAGDAVSAPDAAPVPNDVGAQQPSVATPAAAMPAAPAPLGGLPQPAPASAPGSTGMGAGAVPPAWLSSLLDELRADHGIDAGDDDPADTGEHDSTEDAPHEDDDEPADADPYAAEDDVRADADGDAGPPDEAGPAQTRPDLR